MTKKETITFRMEDKHHIEATIEQGKFKICITENKQLLIKKIGFQKGDQIKITPFAPNEIYIE